jgi:hypothetical protein
MMVETAKACHSSHSVGQGRQYDDVEDGEIQGSRHKIRYYDGPR